MKKVSAKSSYAMTNTLGKKSRLFTSLVSGMNGLKPGYNLIKTLQQRVVTLCQIQPILKESVVFFSFAWISYAEYFRNGARLFAP